MDPEANMGCGLFHSTLTGFVTVILLLACGACERPNEPRLTPIAAPDAEDDRAAYLGFWESAGRCQRSGIAHAIEIDEHGVFRTSHVVMLDIRYVVKDAAMTLTAEGEEPVEVELGQISDVSWSQRRGDQETVHTRVSKEVDPSHPIVGIWKYPHSTGGTAYEHYHASGLLEFRLPFGFIERTWSVEADGSIRLCGLLDPGDSYAARLRDGVLVLDSPTDEDGTFAYKRTEPWYEREAADPAMLRELQVEPAADSADSPGTTRSSKPSGK